ncbi:MAG: DUF3575 domain-containing protein [Campylobacterota bacterium]|nr:DUF3575 domain-containing protein [Campylobacterota bacterium]
MKSLIQLLLIVWASSNLYSSGFQNRSQEIKSFNIDDEIFYNLSFGVSAFECMMGIEVQSTNHSIGLGACRQISYRYYKNPNRDSIFYGIYAGKDSGYDRGESKKKINDIVLKDKDSSFGGIGAGYRWQWVNNWNLTANIALNYSKTKYFNQDQMLEENSLILFPGITVGYRF